jgi:CheY-like chemotaxis protein
MHGGTIFVHSTGLGKGSEFVIRLPVIVERPTHTERIGGEQSKRLTSNLRIEVVDDNHDSANSLGMMLRIMGNDIQIANDGEQAVRVAADFQPDVVLLDIGLPKLNGYEAAQQIREQPWGKKIVLIALTGWGQAEDKRQANEAGFDLHMVKPVDPTSLISILAELHAAKSSTAV